MTTIITTILALPTTFDNDRWARLEKVPLRECSGNTTNKDGIAPFPSIVARPKDGPENNREPTTQEVNAAEWARLREQYVLNEKNVQKAGRRRRTNPD